MRPSDRPLASTSDGQKPEHHDGRLPEEIRFVKFSSIVWTHDSKGFFYHVTCDPILFPPVFWPYHDILSVFSVIQTVTHMGSLQKIKLALKRKAI